MITFRCTARVARRFLLELEPTDEAPSNRLGDWYANLLNVGTARWVLCLNERSLLPVLVPARRAEFPSAFPAALDAVLRGIGVPAGIAAREAGLSSAFRFDRTRDRSVLGSLNEVAFTLDLSLRESDDPLRAAIDHAGRPCTPLPLVFPDRTVFALLGLGTLEIVEYLDHWPGRYAIEAQRVTLALGDLAVAIEHVGSTAVPGLAGKPVLDLAVAVASEAAADACVAPLEALGYTHRGSHGDDPRRRYYVRDSGRQRIAQLHLYVLPAPAWNEKLAFRDALRADPSLAAAYEAEKRRAAEATGWDRAAYAVAKGPFIQAVLAQIRASTLSPHPE